MLHPGCARFRLVAVAVSLMLSAWGSDAARKYVVRDAETARAWTATGARVVVDYGSFQVVEANAAPPASVQAVPADELDHLELNVRRINTRAAEAQSRRRPVGAFAGRRLHLVQFHGPVRPDWMEALRATGVRVVSYIPHNAYLVYGSAGELTRLQTWAARAPHVQWEGDYADEFKIHPRARLPHRGDIPGGPAKSLYALQLVDDPEANAATLARVHALRIGPVKRQWRLLGYLNLIVALPPERLDELARRPEVISIHPYIELRKWDERQCQIVAGNLAGTAPAGPGYLAWLTTLGFTQEQFDASGFAVDVTDSGIDNGTLMPGHPGLFRLGETGAVSRVVYSRLEGNPSPGSTLEGCDGHGTLNAHIIAGYCEAGEFPHADTNGFRYGLGVCPFVKVGASVIFDPNFYTWPDHVNLIARAWQDGARISNNSWGSTGNGSYDSDTQTYDALVRDAQPAGAAVEAPRNQEMVILFAAGNAGPNFSTVSPPATGKNVMAVGATENVHPFGGHDGSWVTDSQADSVDDIAEFSSRGPAADGRFKPDLCAPGTHVSGGVAQASAPGLLGTALACFNGGGVSGGVNSMFFPPGQEFYTASSGTSHSVPAAAGACALLRQFFLNRFGVPPSPALSKAWLMNSARYLTGTSALDTLPSPAQGMGGLDIGRAFDGVPRKWRDQVPTDLFTATGQTRTFYGLVADPDRPFRVTLVWTDAPGNTAGNAYNNNLDLIVQIGGNVYRGNVFDGAHSVPDGQPDFKNNVESVFLPPGVSGAFTITILAANINSDGVPGNEFPLDQDFALVAYNALGETGASLMVNGVSVVAESCAPANGVADPGETVTVRVGLQNAGTGASTNLVATLLATNGVLSGCSQNYGAIPTNGLPVARLFTFTVTGPCGETVPVVLELTDDGQPLGQVIVPLPLGVISNCFGETFDTISPPTLPAGWASAASGVLSPWVAADTAVDTPPYAAFVAVAARPGIAELVSPAIALPAGPVRLSFRHSFHTEASPGSPTVGYDGGVLEIKIGEGPFLDLVAAGGDFELGGYNRTLSSSFNNPLGGRRAWSGDSGGFVTTTALLPPAASGHAVQLRWRLGTDSGDEYGGIGWWVDSIGVSAPACCDNPSPQIVLEEFRHGTEGQVQFRVIGNPTAGPIIVEMSPDLITWSSWLTNVPPFSFTVTNSPTAPELFFRARSHP